MMKLITAIFTLFSFAIISCGPVDPNKQIDEGNVKGKIYESKEIGWSIEIPKDWTIISKDKRKANAQNGNEAIEKTSGLEIDTKALKYLISFQKNQFNLFISTSEPFKEDSAGEYQENKKAINELIYKTVIDKSTKVDSSSGKEIIQGLEFNTFYITIYSPDGKVIFNQIIYNRLINGFDFGVAINYNNEQDKKAMMDAWKNSKFN